MNKVSEMFESFWEKNQVKYILYAIRINHFKQASRYFVHINYCLNIHLSTFITTSSKPVIAFPTRLKNCCHFPIAVIEKAIPS